MTDADGNKLLWQPSAAQMKASRLYEFIRASGANHHDFSKILQWSVENLEDFWSLVWNFCGVIGDKSDTVIDDVSKFPGARFFPNSKINYAENMLARADTHPDEPAIIYRHQDGQDRILSWQQLYDQVSIWDQALRRAGLQKGDRIGVYLPNVPETAILLLAASNIGATVSSAGMEMGSDDLINRFGQVQPKILITGDGYRHGDKNIDRRDVIVRAQSDILSLEHIVVMPQINSVVDGDVQQADIFLKDIQPENITFERHDFNHPLYIVFSSGSTGKPKCFEHSTGGVLLKHATEFQLHCDVQSGDKVFYHATPSWMMWNWLVGGLGNGATILLYDGNPAHPDPYVQWDFITDHNCTHHGTAAPLIMSWVKNELDMAARYGEKLAPLRAIMSTGAVLPAQGFEFIHQHIKQDVKIGSISGGTDIVGCFLGGNPLSPTYAGCLNGPMLGLDVRIVDDQGQEVQPGETGELACFNVFPSMPLCFLDDPDMARYRGEYFENIDGAWHHGDSVTLTEEGQYMIVGRSDATLNQGGVRIGTAAIYDQVAAAAPGLDCAAASFMTPDGEAKTVLFLATDNITDDLAKAIKKAVKDNVTPYAIPTEILAVPDILKTPNGKKAEVVIKKIINGTAIPNASLYGEALVATYQSIGAELKAKYAA